MIELAAALGMTADGCRRYVGRVLEVRYRLARLWARVTDGELPWWRAARIADHTLALPMAGAISVDRRLAPVAHKVGIVQTERLCQEALDRFDPQEAEARRLAAAEARHVDLPTRDAGPRPARSRSPHRSTWPTPSTSRPRSPRPPPN